MRRKTWIILLLLLTAVTPLRAEEDVDMLVAYILDALEARQMRCTDGQLEDHDGERVVCGAYTSSFSAFRADWELVMRHDSLPLAIDTDETWTFRRGSYERIYTHGADRELWVGFAPDDGAIVFVYEQEEVDPYATVATTKTGPLDLPEDDVEPAPRMAGFGGVPLPTLIEESHVEPLRSPRAKTDRAAGRVTLEVVIGSDGNVRDVIVLKEEPEGYDFGEAATDAVMQWRFEPAVVEGKPIPVVLNRTVEVKQDPPSGDDG